MRSRHDKADSPCIAVCTYFPDSKVCRGCFRRIDEIWNWPTLTPADRHEVLKKSNQRKAEYMNGADFSV